MKSLLIRFFSFSTTNTLWVFKYNSCSRVVCPQACYNGNYQDGGSCDIRRLCVCVCVLSPLHCCMRWLIARFRCLLEYCWNMFMSWSFLMATWEPVREASGSLSKVLYKSWFIFVSQTDSLTLFFFRKGLTLIVGWKWRPQQQWNTLTWLDGSALRQQGTWTTRRRTNIAIRS